MFSTIYLPTPVSPFHAEPLQEKKAILDFHAKHPLEGYRRFAFMMLDADVVAVSPPASIAYSTTRD